MQYYQDKVMKMCEDSGHTCAKWPNWKIYEDLKFLDEKDNGHRADEYWKSCHSPHFSVSIKYGSTEPKIEIRCMPNNMTSCEFCNYENEDVKNKIKEEFKFLLEVFSKNETDFE